MTASDADCLVVFDSTKDLGYILLLSGTLGLSTGVVFFVIAVTNTVLPRPVTPSHAVRKVTLGLYIYRHYISRALRIYTYSLLCVDRLQTPSYCV